MRCSAKTWRQRPRAQEESDLESFDSHIQRRQSQSSKQHPNAIIRIYTEKQLQSMLSLGNKNKEVRTKEMSHAATVSRVYQGWRTLGGVGIVKGVAEKSERE